MRSLTEALQDALAAEHAAVWSYGVLGGQTSESGSPQLYALLARAYRAHRDRRDTLRQAIRRQGATPIAAAVAYELPGGTATAAAVRSTGVTLERRLTQVYASLVAHSSRDRRRWAVQALEDSALQQVALGGQPEAFPGLPDR